MLAVVWVATMVVLAGCDDNGGSGGSGGGNVTGPTRVRAPLSILGATLTIRPNAFLSSTCADSTEEDFVREPLSYHFESRTSIRFTDADDEDTLYAQ